MRACQRSCDSSYFLARREGCCKLLSRNLSCLKKAFCTSPGASSSAFRLCLAACRQKRRVRFVTAAALVNEMMDAKQNNQVRRAMARWQRYELIAIDEVGYVPLADVGAEFLFQVISERAERAAVILTTNLPFSEWTTVFPNPRLCKALLDRVTDRAHIIETGTESFRFRRTLERRKKA
jgi:DNA replication protein DnaC